MSNKDNELQNTHPDSAAPPSENRLKIPVEELKMGMYVAKLDRPWLDSPFAFQGFTLNSESDIRAVQKTCSHVYIDVEKSHAEAFQKKVPVQDPASETSFNEQAKNKRKGPVSRIFNRLSGRTKTKALAADISRTVETSRKTVEETSKLVRSIMDDVRLGKSIDTPAAKAAVSDCVDQIINNPDALLLLSNIKDKDAYTSEHSLNVSILSIALGHRMGMPRDKLEELGLSGLLHDVGKVFTPDEVLKKPGRLTPEEFLIMKMHPAQGRDILLSTDGISGSALDVAHTHHERLDRSGYPRGLPEENISLFSKIVAITDTFDAITSDRVYGEGRTNIDAFKILQSCGGNRYQCNLVSEFIDTIGVYPPGSIAQLNNGKIGVVVRANPQFKLRPVMLILKDHKQRPLSPHYIDLADLKDNNKGKLQIARMLRAKDVGIDTHVFRDQMFLSSLGD